MGASADHHEIQQALREYVAREILDGRDAGLDASTPLLEWGVLNSMEVTRMFRFIGDRFDVSVPPDLITAEHLENLTAITNLVIEARKQPVAVHE